MNANTKLKYTRLATLNDVPEITKMAAELASTTTFKGVSYDHNKLRQVVEGVIIGTPKTSLMLVSVDDKDTVVGFIAGVPMEISFMELQSSMEIGWFVRPGTPGEKKRYLELREGYEEWARRQDFKFVQYAILNPTEKDIRDINNSKNSTVLELVYHRRIDQGD